MRRPGKFCCEAKDEDFQQFVRQAQALADLLVKRKWIVQGDGARAAAKQHIVHELYGAHGVDKDDPGAIKARQDAAMELVAYRGDGLAEWSPETKAHRAQRGSFAIIARRRSR